MQKLKNRFVLAFVLGILVLIRPLWAAELDYNDYEKLPCATEPEFTNFAKLIHLEGVLDGELCDQSRKAKLGKLLKLASFFKTSDQGWNGGAVPALLDPLAYLSEMVNKVAFDFATESVAYNKNKQVYLGSLFFKDGPLEALGTFVHEARHSSEGAPRHVRCNHGDLPLSQGSCDKQMSLNEKSAGSYAYEVSWKFGVAFQRKDLPASNREYLISSALSLLGTRFNQLPAELGLPFDVVALLDRGGVVSFLHPFLKRLIRAPSLPEGETALRMEFNTRTNGLLLYTRSSQIYELTPGKAPSKWKAQRFLPERHSSKILEHGVMDVILTGMLSIQPTN